MKQELVAQLKLARRASVPLLAITTPDFGETARAARIALNGDGPKFIWDLATGARPVDAESREHLHFVWGSPDADMTVGDPLALLKNIASLPATSIVFMFMADRCLVDPNVIQAAWNLRDLFKDNQRMLVMLGHAFKLPPELNGDVLVLDEPLPTKEDIREIVGNVANSSDVTIQPEPLDRSVEALQGLTAFAAEQATAMCLTKKGVDVAGLWERKRRTIENTPGLQMWQGKDTFDTIGGLSVVKEYMQRFLNGRRRPEAIVWADELEKAMAGAKGDSSGVSQDFLGQLLTYMEDHGCYGMIFAGPPGAGKSAIAKAAGNEAGIKTIRLDLGGMKGSLVGQSETQLRDALKVITAVGNNNTLWIATCNSVANLDTALLRRFPDLFFFDLPDREEKDAIWNVWTKRFELPPMPLLNDSEWAGANIQKCCEKAWSLECSIKEAAQFIVPVGHSARTEIETLRNQADGKWLSASYPGPYQRNRFTTVDNAPTSRRKVTVE